jgi:UDP-N-acetylmuramate--alanine ligase
MNLSKIKKAYFIGIKGVGMTALAQVLQGWGIKVLGSDVEEKFFTDEVLRKLKIKIFEGFRAENIPSDADLIVASSAYSETHPEIQYAKKQGWSVYSYSDILAMLFEKSYGLGVAGTHGKTTTTAMLGRVFEELGLDPTVIVGSKVLAWGSNARVGRSKYLVAELDEYQEKFLKCQPKILILTNIEYDHPDFFKNFEAYKKVFLKLVTQLPPDGLLIGCSHSQVVQELLKKAPCPTISYSLEDLEKFGGLSLELPGQHNQLNALAVLTLIKELKLDVKKAKKVLEGFKGTARRFEIKGKLKNGVWLIDDYAHHPTEIRATLKAARQLYPQQRIWCIFQPHTFTRTKALGHDFARSFGLADQVLILDIYGSVREKSGRVHAKDLVRLILKYQPKTRYIPDVQKAADYLKEQIQQGDVIITMGAGDVWKLSICLQGQSPSS